MKIGDKLIARMNIIDPNNHRIFLFTENVPYIIKGFIMNYYVITSNDGIQTVTLEFLEDFFNLTTNDPLSNFDYAMGIL